MDQKQHFFIENILVHEKEYFRFILKRVHSIDAANDILQTAYLKAWKHIDQLNDPSKAKSWTYAIIVNCMREHWRSLEKERSRFDILDTDEGNMDMYASSRRDVEDTLDIVIENFESELVIKAFARMEPNEAMLMKMRYIDKMKIKELAKFLNLSENVTSSTILRIRNKYREIYREILKEEGDGDNDIYEKL